MAGTGTLGSLVYFIKANNSNFKQNMNEVGNILRSTNKKFEEHKQKLTSWAKTWGIVGTSVLTTMTMLTSKFNALNKEIANIGTLIPNNAKRLQELKRDIQELAIETGKSTRDLAQGAYWLISALGDSADTVQKLKINAKAAAAGLAETTDAIRLTTAVTKAYGDVSAEATEKAADLAFITLKLGQTSFPELAHSIGQVTPLAAQLNMEQEEMWNIFATLTGVTGDTARVATQAAAILRAFIKPTEDMSKAVKQLGYDSASALLSDRGLVGALKAVMSTTDGTEEAVGRLFGRAEALTAVFALTGSQADVFTTKLDQMKKSAGALNDAYKEQTQGINSLGHQWDRMQQKLAVGIERMGDFAADGVRVLTDGVEALVNWIGKAADWFNNLPKPMRELISTSVVLTSTIMGLTAAVIALTAAFKKFSLASGPAGWITLAIGLLATGIAAVTTSIRNAREEQEKFIERQKELADKIGNEARELNNLLDRYDELMSKTSLTKEEQEELNDVVAKIGEIAPEAATKWDELGNAIEINAEKARQAAKDMLEARKSLLEVAKERAEYEIPLLEGTIKKEEAKVRAAEQSYADAKARYNEAVKLQTEAQKLQNRLLAGESAESVYQDALAKGIVRYEGAYLQSELDYWLNEAVGYTEKEMLKAAEERVKVGSKYDEAKEKLAQLKADLAELVAINAQMEEGDLYAGLDSGETPTTTSTGEGGMPKVGTDFDLDEFLRQLDKELKDIDKIAATFGDTSNVASDKADALRKAIITLVVEGIDPTNTAMGNLVEQYKEFAKEAGKTYDLIEAKKELLDALDDVSKQEEVFGDSLDANRKRLNLFRDAIIDAILNEEPIENIQDLIDEYRALEKAIDDATTAELNNKAATDLLTQGQDYLSQMTGKITPEWERFAQKLEEAAAKDGVLPEVAAQLREIADQIRGVGAEMEPERNWFTDMFEEIGYKIEEAHDIFQSFRDGLIDGFTEIITKGKSVGDVFKQISDYLAEMIVKKGIVEPIVDWVLSGIGLGSAHIGALVTPAGLVHDLPSYHSGGVVPGLRSDERIIKVLTGERILSREQNKKFEAGEYGKTEVTYEFNINAVDAASFVQLVRRHPEAITSVVAGDIVSDGPLRKTIMRYTK